MSNTFRTVSCLVCAAAIVVGCQVEEQEAASAAGVKSAMSPQLTGSVIEKLDAGRYTYLQILSGHRLIWIAAPTVAVKKGQRVTCPPGMIMRNFTSDALNRKFDDIVFVGGVSIVNGDGATNAPGMPAGHPPLPGGHGAVPAGHPPIGGQQAVQPVPSGPTTDGVVLSVEQVKRYTYIEVKSDDKTIWAAAPTFQVKKGDRVSVPEGMLMKNFNSPSLKKTFEEIYFTSGIRVTPPAKK